MDNGNVVGMLMRRDVGNNDATKIYGYNQIHISECILQVFMFIGNTSESHNSLSTKCK